MPAARRAQARHARPHAVAPSAQPVQPIAAARKMGWAMMTKEQRYLLDLQGFLVVEGALSAVCAGRASAWHRGTDRTVLYAALPRAELHGSL